jgi:hypothetical protein
MNPRADGFAELSLRPRMAISEMTIEGAGSGEAGER